MTTIFVDIRRGILVADAFQEHLGHMRVLSGHKSLVLSSGDIVAWSGCHEQGIAWAQWMEDGEVRSDAPDFKDGNGICLRNTGECYFYGDRCVPLPIREPYYAIGSGAEFTLGAMRILETMPQPETLVPWAYAVEAMKVACHFDTYTFFPLTVYTTKGDVPLVIHRPFNE